MEVKMEVPIELKAKGQPDDDGMFRFEALGSTFGNIDLVDDVMVKGCFLESLESQTPVILWQHDRFKPIGMPEMIVETEAGLKLNVIMPGDDDFVKGRVMPQLRIGSIKAMSIGFRVVDFFIRDGIRFITKCILKEVSLVTFPANEMATVTSVKSIPDFQGDLPFAPRSHSWNENEAVKRLEEAKSCDKSFMWCDKSNEDGSASLKLPFVDIVDGKKTIIPRALFKIRSALQGAKSSVNMQKSDEAKITVLVNRYIEKLDKVEPAKMLEVTDVEKMSKRELEKALRESGYITKAAAVKIASSFPEAGEPTTEDEDAIVKKAEAILGVESNENNEKAILEKCNSILN